MKDHARARFYFQSKNSVCDCRRPNTHRERERERERERVSSFFQSHHQSLLLENGMKPNLAGACLDTMESEQDDDEEKKRRASDRASDRAHRFLGSLRINALKPSPVPRNLSRLHSLD
jgi:hypothetical protein